MPRVILAVSTLLVLSILLQPIEAQVPDLRSRPSNTKVEVTFRNLTAKPITVHWVDFQGKVTKGGTVQSGATSKSGGTYSGHVYVARQNGRVIQTIVIGGEPKQRFDIQGQPPSERPKTDVDGPRYVLRSGETLNTGEYLVSSSGRYFAIVEAGGFSIYNGSAPDVANSTKVWTAADGGPPFSRSQSQASNAIVNLDGSGNLFVGEGETRDPQRKIFETGSHAEISRGGGFVALHDSGHLVMFAGSETDPDARKIDKLVWNSANLGSTLRTGQELRGQYYLSSPGKKFYAKMDGSKLTIFRGVSPFHSEQTWGQHYYYSFDKRYDTRDRFGNDATAGNHAYFTKIGYERRSVGNTRRHRYIGSLVIYAAIGDSSRARRVWNAGEARGAGRSRPRCFLQLTDAGQLLFCRGESEQDADTTVAWKSPEPNSYPVRLFKESYANFKTLHWKTRHEVGKDDGDLQVTWTSELEKAVEPVVFLKAIDTEGDNTKLAWDHDRTVRHGLNDRRLAYDPLLHAVGTQTIKKVGYVTLNLEANVTRHDDAVHLALLDSSVFHNETYSRGESTLVGPYLETVSIKFNEAGDAQYWSFLETGPKALNRTGNYSHSQSFNADLAAGLDGSVTAGGGFSESYGSSTELKDFEFEPKQSTLKWRVSQVYDDEDVDAYLRTRDILTKSVGQYDGTKEAPHLAQADFTSTAYQIWRSKGDGADGPSQDFAVTLSYEVTYRQVILTDELWDNLQYSLYAAGPALPLLAPAAGALGPLTLAAAAGGAVLANPDTYEGKLGKDWTSFKYVHKFDVHVRIPKELLRR